MSQHPLTLAAWATMTLTLCAWQAPAGAAGRVPYGGHLRVVVPSDDMLRWHQSVSDCYLFRARPGGSPEPELAHGHGGFDAARMTVRIVDGARFHDGTPITGEDVVASLRSAGAGRTSLERALGLLTVRLEAPQTLTVRGPPGVSAATLRGMLAHPLAAIRRGGSRCGPFMPGKATGKSTIFVAHLGHPRGRPWLDRVEIFEAASPEQAVEEFVFGDLEASVVPIPRNRRVTSKSSSGWGTVFAIPGDGWRGRARSAARRRVASLMHASRFGAFFDTAVVAPDGLLPPALSPRLAGRDSTPSAAKLALDDLTIAYPAERSDLADLARAVRDTLRGEVAGVARVTPVPGLDLAQANAASPGWDLALVQVDWTAVDAVQGIIEASGRLPVPSLRPEEALGGALSGWLAARRERAEVIPVVHVARPVFHRDGWHLATGSGSAGGLASSWRRP